MIGVPSAGHPIVLDWAFAFAQLHPPMNYDVRYVNLRNQPVDAARNQIAEAAIREKARYLFFLGDDVTPPPFAIRQLIFHLEHYPEYAIAGGVYCHKAQPTSPLVFRGNGLGPYWDWKVGEVFDVSGIGMDCTLIRVQALADLEKPWFRTVETLEQYRDGVPKGESWTEDLFFCQRLTDKGWKIMADGGILCGHWDWQTNTCYQLPQDSKPRWLAEPDRKKGGKKVVDLGSGELAASHETPEGDVLRVDIREEVKPDYRCDLRQLPFQTGQFDVVFSSHTLEHFPRAETEQVLDEWIRILHPDGELRLVLPNVEWAARHVMNGEIDVDVMNVLYGAQTYEENFHKMGFTPKMLEQLLTQRGFKKFEWDFHNYHMLVRAWKRQDADAANPAVKFNKGPQQDKAFRLEFGLKQSSDAATAVSSVVRNTAKWRHVRKKTKKKARTQLK